jgi:cyclase
MFRGLQNETSITMGRRQFLCTAMAGATLGVQKKQPAVLLDRGFARVIQIAPNVYATIADPSKGMQCGSNGGIIAGRNAMVIVEGHLEPAGAAFEIEVARMVGKAPIRAAINTHYHFDHTFGNSAYADQGIPIIAHYKTASLMQERYVALKGVNKTPLLATLEEKAAQAFDAVDKARKLEDMEQFKAMYAAIDSTAITLPTELLLENDLPKRIDVDGLTCVIEFRPGHTPTDLIIRIPDRDVVFTGDVLFYRSYPIAIDADMIAWRKVLDRLSSYGRRTQFIPGHGPVCGVETVREQAAIMDDLHAHAVRMVRIGATADEATRRYVVPRAFQSYRQFGWGWRVGAAMQNLYQNLVPPTRRDHRS